MSGERPILLYPRHQKPDDLYGKKNRRSEPITAFFNTEGGNQTGWIAPAPTGVVLRHTAVVMNCSRKAASNASYNSWPRFG